jgi:hypothetical protein
MEGGKINIKNLKIYILRLSQTQGNLIIFVMSGHFLYFPQAPQA